MPVVIWRLHQSSWVTKNTQTRSHTFNSCVFLVFRSLHAVARLIWMEYRRLLEFPQPAQIDRSHSHSFGDLLYAAFLLVQKIYQCHWTFATAATMGAMAIECIERTTSDGFFSLFLSRIRHLYFTLFLSTEKTRLFYGFTSDYAFCFCRTGG